MEFDFTADVEVMLNGIGSATCVKRFTDSDGDEQEIVFSGILLQPTRTIDFSGVNVVSNDWTLDYGNSVELKENDVISITSAPLRLIDARFAVRTMQSSDIGILAQAKLRKL